MRVDDGPSTPRLLAGVALRLLLCGLCAWLLWRVFGAVGLVGSAMLFAAALARPLIDLAGDLRGAVKAAAWQDVEGRHYAFHGHAFAVDEDDDHHRWLRVADVRKVLPAFPRTAVLQARYGERVRATAAAGRSTIRADALHDYLAQATDAEAVRLRSWLHRDVIQPAERIRQRLGIRDEPPPRAERHDTA